MDIQIKTIIIFALTKTQSRHRALILLVSLEMHFWYHHMTLIHNIPTAH